MYVVVVVVVVMIFVDDLMLMIQSNVNFLAYRKVCSHGKLPTYHLRKPKSLSSE